MAVKYLGALNLQRDDFEVENQHRIRVVHVIVGLDVGGAERALFRLLRAHANSPSFKHSVISLTSKGSLMREFEAIGVGVSTLNMRSIFYAPIAFFRILKEIQAADPDVVQCWMYYSDLIGGLAAKILRVKTILWGVRNSHFEEGGTLLKKVIRKLCAWLSFWIPSKVVCVAQAARTVHEDVGYAKSKMCVIPNGYDVNEFSYSRGSRSSIRSILSLQDTEVLVGSVARYSAAKDHKTFILAASEAVKSNRNLRFALIGRDLVYENSVIRGLLEEHGVAEYFFLLGEKNDIPSWMSAMDIFCLHSKTEGFPNVLGEAMSVGLPCIATNVGDAAMLLGGAGIIVPPCDHEALAGALINMANMADVNRRQLGSNARGRIEREYSLLATTSMFEAIYISGNK